MAIRKRWRFCPECGLMLAERKVEGEPYLGCTGESCSFIDFNNPIPVVAALIPHEGGIVLVQRGVEPFVGRWCLPRGYLRSNENPKGAAVREVREETGFSICLKRMLNACNPSPVNFPLNQLTMFYLATVSGGIMQAGDDAQAVGIFKTNALPDICFSTDVKLIADWATGVHGTIDNPVNYSPPRSKAATGD